jgi:hypothetical protein
MCHGKVAGGSRGWCRDLHSRGRNTGNVRVGRRLKSDNHSVER